MLNYFFYLGTDNDKLFFFFSYFNSESLINKIIEFFGKGKVILT